MEWDDVWQLISRVETQLRRLLRLHLGSEAELLSRHADVGTRLTDRRSKRDDDLLHYTEIRDLIDMIEVEWGSGIEAAFSRKQKAVVSDLHRIADLRNAPAHSRLQTYGQRALAVGLCSLILDDLSRYESERDPNDEYYPVLLTAIDRFGTSSTKLLGPTGGSPLGVGDPIHFDCVGRDVRGRDLHWKLSVQTSQLTEEVLATTSGEAVTLSAVVPASAVGQRRQFIVSMWVESEYHRLQNSDASVAWWYEVRPPDFD